MDIRLFSVKKLQLCRVSIWTFVNPEIAAKSG